MPTELARKPIKKSDTVNQRVIDKACEVAVNELLEKIGTEKFTCNLCGTLLEKDGFYKTGNPKSKTGIVPICKECCKKIFYDFKSDGRSEYVSQMANIILVLSYINKPFYKGLWDASIVEANKSLESKGKRTVDAFQAYMKNITMKQYHNKTFLDGDDSTQASFNDSTDVFQASSSKTLKELLPQNRYDILNVLGYDPFESASNTDKPFLYNKLNGMLDESATEDEVKLSACIEITHAFNQTEKLNQNINYLQSSSQSLEENATKIKTLADTKNKLLSSALSLAKENGITIINSNKNTKGADTWTGKVKEMRELDLREAELNCFDIETCKGMQQVAELSMQAIFKQLSFDENDYTDMIKQQREMLEELNSKVNLHEEEYRVLKRENLDLKNLLRSKGLINDKDEVIYDSIT